MNLRNIAIIAHVDHGKTTLVDRLLRQSGTFRDNQQVAERAMDSNDLERERGITILANAPRSPGRIRASISSIRRATPISAARSSAFCRWSMASCCWSMPPKGRCRRPNSWCRKALAIGLKPIVVINKIDRPDARAAQVHDEVFDLFAALDATEEQLDFPMLYASGRNGWAVEKLGDEPERSGAAVRSHHAPCAARRRSMRRRPSRCWRRMLEANPYLGRIADRPHLQPAASSRIMPVKALDRDGQGRRTGPRHEDPGLPRPRTRRRSTRREAGDIVAIAGLEQGDGRRHDLRRSTSPTPMHAQPDRSADDVR